MPDRLYHYCSIGDEEHRGWFEQLILERLIYFRNRDQLNDPEEFRPTMIYDGTEEEKTNYLFSLIANRAPWLSGWAVWGAYLQILDIYSGPDKLSGMLHDVADGVGIFCLSESWTLPQMWARYAEGHRGVCIEFDATVAPFVLAEKVQYVDVRPIINRRTDDRAVGIKKSLLTKGAQWASEAEWRMLARWQDNRRIAHYLEQHEVTEDVRQFVLSQHGPGTYTIPKRAVLRVALGDAISDHDAEFVTNVVDAASWPITICRAKMDWNKVTVS